MISLCESEAKVNGTLRWNNSFRGSSVKAWSRLGSHGGKSKYGHKRKKLHLSVYTSNLTALFNSVCDSHEDLITKPF